MFEPQVIEDERLVHIRAALSFVQEHPSVIKTENEAHAIQIAVDLLATYDEKNEALRAALLRYDKLDTIRRAATYQYYMTGDLREALEDYETWCNNE